MFLAGDRNSNAEGALCRSNCRYPGEAQPVGNSGLMATPSDSWQQIASTHAGDNGCSNDYFAADGACKRQFFLVYTAPHLTEGLSHAT
jgi:hypothetical protein